MTQEKDKWSNKKNRLPEDYLSPEDFLKVKAGLKSAWRKLGWIHLRMTNDLDVKSKSPLTKIEIHRRLEEVKQELLKIDEAYLKEE